MKSSKRFITLIELMLVLAIIALVAGVVSINIRKTIVEQRFRSEVGVVVDKLRLAQNLMLILDTDIHVKLAQTPKGISCSMEFACPLSKGWGKELSTPHLLETVHVVDFRDQLQMHEKQGVIDIRFLSGGTVMSRGILRLSTVETKGSEGALERFVCLKGYPHPISSVQDESNEASCLTQDDTLMSDNLTSATMQEIASKKAQEEQKPEPQKTEPEIKPDASVKFSK